MTDTGVPDGIKVDTWGNVWTGMGDGVACYSPGARGAPASFGSLVLQAEVWSGVMRLAAPAVSWCTTWCDARGLCAALWCAAFLRRPPCHSRLVCAAFCPDRRLIKGVVGGA